MRLSHHEDAALIREVMAVCEMCHGKTRPHERARHAALGWRRCDACDHLQLSVAPVTCGKCRQSISVYAKVWRVCPTCHSIEASSQVRCTVGKHWYPASAPPLCFKCAHGFAFQVVAHGRRWPCNACGEPTRSRVGLCRSCRQKPGGVTVTVVKEGMA